MAAKKRRGERSLVFDSPPRVISGANIVGEVEGQGPLSGFDLILSDDTWGEDSWEKAECKMFETAVRMAIEKGGLQEKDVHCLLGGDLLDQIISANFAARQLGIPFIGLYGACSTMAESLLVGCTQIDGGYADHTVCVASSHFSTAERQYRAPLEMGNTLPPTAQRTVTGAGAVLLSAERLDNQGRGEVYKNICITGATLGKVIDLGIADANNMGAAMAPAAADTILSHLQDMGQDISAFDAVITGDLGTFGSEMLVELCSREGLDIVGRHLDCGNLIYTPSPNIPSGGSGCGCSACVLTAHILPMIETGSWKRVLFLATGALLSPESSLQGETIPGIAHAVVLQGGM